MARRRILTIRLTDKEMEKVQFEAGLRGWNVGQYVRNTILGYGPQTDGLLGQMQRRLEDLEEKAS